MASKPMKAGKSRQKPSAQPIQRFARPGTPKGALGTTNENTVVDHTIAGDGVTTTPDSTVNRAGS